MKLFAKVLSLAVAVVLVAGFAGAAEKKEVTLKGDLACAKCELKVEGVKKCTNAFVVKDGAKEVVYFVIDDKKVVDHEDLCGGGRKAATVTGVVSEKEGQKYLTVSKVELAKSK
jgi:hypothetical protein